MAPPYHFILWLGSAAVGFANVGSLALGMVFCLVAVGQKIRGMKCR